MKNLLSYQKKGSMIGLGFCVWLATRKYHSWWLTSRRLCDETNADFCRPHVRLLEGAKTHREAAVRAPPFSGVFRVSSWMEPRAEVMRVEGWPPLHRIVFDGHMQEKNMELEVARRFGDPFQSEDLSTASELFRNEPFEMEDPMRFIVRVAVPEVRRWKDISP